MEVLEALVILILVIVWIGLAVLSGFFIYWIGRILIIIPDRLNRITAAFEKMANK